LNSINLYVIIKSSYLTLWHYYFDFIFRWPC